MPPMKSVRDLLKAVNSEGTLGKIIAGLKRRFPDKSDLWYARALYRIIYGQVVETGAGWMVRGLPELGDTQPWYYVYFDGRRYVCSCYATAFGWRRAREVCTHVAAVMLHRRGADRRAPIAVVEVEYCDITFRGVRVLKERCREAGACGPLHPRLHCIYVLEREREDAEVVADGVRLELTWEELPIYIADLFES